jgi:hypothetical protein
MAVNLAKYLRFVRTQGGDGCWGNAGCAVWDILNEIASPNCPNMSMNPWLMIHRRSDLFEVIDNGKNRLWHFNTPDGRYFTFKGGPEYGFFQSYGNSTEGCEPTIPIGRWVGGFTEEGCNEAQNYRLKGNPATIVISSQSFRTALDKNRPIRLAAGQHWVAIIGYDEVKKLFTYVDSANYADRTGFGTLTFADIDQGKAGSIGKIIDAQTWEVIPPRPVPTAIIHIKHKTSRMNMNLWLSLDGNPHPARKIWPAWEWPEEDRLDLNFKVRLPAGLIWPPSAANRVILDIYDSGAIGSGGGEIVECYAAFGAHVINCQEVLTKGPIAFKAGEHKRLYIPT